MKRFNLNKIKVAHLIDVESIIAGADTNDIVYTDKVKACGSKDCGSANAIICTNTTIQHDPTTTPNDTVRTTINP